MLTTQRFAVTPIDKRVAMSLRQEIAQKNLEAYGRDFDGALDPVMDGRTLSAFIKGRIVGTLDVHWGGDKGIPAKKRARFGVDEIVKGAVDAEIVVLDAPIVHPDHVEDEVAVELKLGAVRFGGRKGARWVFSMCEPYEVASHRALGFVQTGGTVRLAGLGVYVPMVVDLADDEGLRNLGSPFAGARHIAASRRSPSQPDVDSDLPDPIPEPEGEEAPWRSVHRIRKEARASAAAFLGTLQESEVGRVLLKSSLVKATAGDVLVRRGDRGGELFLVLVGTVEVRQGARVLGIQTPGDVFGEIGLLLNSKRTADIVAASDDVRVLKIPRERIDQLTEEEPALAARLLLGIARGVAWKLVRADIRRSHSR